MLRSTFCHLPGIGPRTEAELWAEGIVTWEALADALREGRPGRGDAPKLLRALEASEAALADGDALHFAEHLPAAEHWRIYPSFRDATAFLDIETTSLSPYEGIVTVVTVHGGGRTRSFVADDDLEELPAYLRPFRLLVTFNGSLFDVPFLKVRFPQLVPPPVHVDLRFVLYRLGQAGGLKRIEERLGIGRSEQVHGLAGLDAVRLWHEYRAGRTASLQRLVAYNRADTVNLEPLLGYAVKELTRRLLPQAAPVV